MISRSFLAIYCITHQSLQLGSEEEDTDIVVATKQNQQDTNGRWEQEKSVFCECVGIQEPAPVSHADFVQ